MNKTGSSKSSVQLVWGIALTAIGVAVFFRVQQVIPQLAAMGQSASTLGFVRICFYIIGVLLVGGGIKKIVRYFQPRESSRDEPPSAGT
jgi:hypothetical protein